MLFASRSVGLGGEGDAYLERLYGDSFSSRDAVEGVRSPTPGGECLLVFAPLSFTFPFLWLAAHPFVIFWRLFLGASILVDLLMLTRNEITPFFALNFFTSGYSGEPLVL